MSLEAKYDGAGMYSGSRKTPEDAYSQIVASERLQPTCQAALLTSGVRAGDLHRESFLSSPSSQVKVMQSRRVGMWGCRLATISPTRGDLYLYLVACGPFEMALHTSLSLASLSHF
mmetsp:Transcript_11470/g.21683  ORF Transcript_11470/g.21683 Transcript_11470/m.21683 type:complete len:116 (+) Transcript_11470:203-550(+)